MALERKIKYPEYDFNSSGISVALLKLLQLDGF